MIRMSVTPRDVVALLNEINAFDPVLARGLVENRVPCNAAIADHPSIQVNEQADGSTAVGVLGVLNGLFGTTSRRFGIIAAEMDESTGQVLCFKLTENDPCPTGG